MAKIILNVTTEIKQAQDDVKKLKNLVNSLGTAFSKMKANKDVTAQIKALTEYNKSLAAAVQKVEKVNNSNAIANEKLAQAQAKTAKETAKAAEATAKATTAKIKSADATGKLHITESKLEQQQYKTAKAAEDLERAQKKNAEAAEDSNKKQKGLVETLMQWSVTAKLVQSGVRLIKSAYDDLNTTLAETEKRIIAIQRVLPEGSVADQDLANRLYDLAIEYGQSFGNVSDIATNFARTGLSYADTINATRAALLALNVAELDSTQATEGMIAIMAQFSLSADQMEEVVDKLNKTADRFPVTTEKLMSALQRMGSAAANSGLSIDESIGLVTALSQSTGRAGANLGTALNSLIQYSKKEKALGVYEKLSPEMAEIVAQYRIGAASILDIWNGLTIEINKRTEFQSEKLGELADYFTSGEGSGLKDELESELGDVFNEINGIYSTANAFRQNYFIALLKNMDTATAAAQTAREAQGYSIKENEKEMDTYEKRVESLKAQWQKLANDEQGWLAFRKGLVEVGSYLLKALEWTGGLRTAAIALGTAFAAAFAPKIIASVKEFVAALQSANTAMGSMAGYAGVIGGILAIISSIVGAVSKYYEELHRANLEAIDSWKNSIESANKLETLSQRYKTLTPQSKEFKDVEEEIITLLGDKVEVLDGLTKGTDGYREALEKLTQTELNDYRRKQEKAAVAAEQEIMRNADYFQIKKAYQPDDYSVVQILRDYFGVQNLNDYASKIRNEGENYGLPVLYYYQQAIGLKNALEEAANEAMLGGDSEKYRNILTSNAMDYVDEYISSHKSVVENFFESAVAGYLQKFLYINNISEISDNKTLDSAKQYVESSFYNSYGVAPSNYLTDTLLKYVDEYVRLTDKAKTGTDNLNDTLEDQDKILGNIKTDYQSIVDAINAGREAEKEAEKATERHNAVLQAQLKLEEAITKAKADYVKNALKTYINAQKTESEIEERRQSIADAELEIEEKKKAVKEAQIDLQKAQDDLEYARRNRTERVFNTTTGMWEYQANQKDVQSAQEKLQQATEKVAEATKNVEKAENDVQKAIENLDKYLQDQAVNELIDAIEENGITSEQIDEIFTKWFGNGGGQWGDGVKNVILTAQKEADTAYLENDNVKKAYENLATAKQTEQEYLRDQAYSSLINRITSGNKMTPGEWEYLSRTYRSMGLSEENISWLYGLLKNGKFFDTTSPTSNSTRLDKNFENYILGREADFVNIIELLKDIVDNTGAAVDIGLGQEPIIKAGIHAHEELLPGADAGVYDRGGVLGGVGGIKATRRPELIIDPDLTRRILTPSSNEAFSKFANALGIIFGNPMSAIGSNPAYSNNWQSANSSDNRSYVVNGVPIPRDAAQRYTIAELFENMQLV